MKPEQMKRIQETAIENLRQKLLRMSSEEKRKNPEKRKILKG